MISLNRLKNLQLHKVIVLSMVLACFAASEAMAFTVHDAMIIAHESNYQVLSEQENLNATRLAKPKAITDFLPTASVSRSYNNINYKNATNLQNDKEQQRSDNLTVIQPIFSGGSGVFGYKTATNQVKSGENRYKSVSNDIALGAVQAYENLLTAREIYNLSVNNENVLKTNLKFTKTRFKHGEVTKTDVLQAEARYANAIAERERANGDVMSAEAVFERTIGTKVPGKMESVEIETVDIPETFESFLKLAMDRNPALLSAKYNSKAFEQNVNGAYSRILPTVDARAVMSRSSRRGVANTDNNTYSVNVSIPIFQNGSEYVNISESQYLSKKARYDYFETERQVKEAAIRAWNDLKVARAVIVSRKETIEAARKALAGVTEEAKIGTRTTLDVLDAEQELFSSRIGLRTAQRDYVFAAFTILQIMGAIDLYDPNDI